MTKELEAAQLLSQELTRQSGYIFAAICFIITLLVAFQIFQYMNIDRKIKSIDKVIDRRFEDFDGHTASSVCLALGKISCTSHQILTLNGYNSDTLNHALLHIAQAFENINNCPIKTNIPQAYEALNATLDQIDKLLDILNSIEPQTITRIIKVVMQDNSSMDGIDRIGTLTRLIKINDRLNKVRTI